MIATLVMKEKKGGMPKHQKKVRNYKRSGGGGETCKERKESKWIARTWTMARRLQEGGYLEDHKNSKLWKKLATKRWKEEMGNLKNMTQAKLFFRFSKARLEEERISGES